MIRRRLSGALVLAGAWAEDFSCCFYPAVNNRCAVCETFATSDDFCAQSQSNCEDQCRHKWCRLPTACPTIPAPSPRPSTAPTTLKPTISKAPTTAAPSTTVPTTAEPSTQVPTTAEPSTLLPTTSKPTTSMPTTSGPTTSEPTTSRPTSKTPTTSEPTSPAPSPFAGYRICCLFSESASPCFDCSGFAASTDANPFCALSASNCESCEGTFCPGENAGTAAYTYQPTRAPTPKPLPTPKPTIAPSSSGYSICCLFSSTGAPCTACGGFIASTDTNPFCASSEANCDSCGGEFCKGENAGTAAYTFPPTPESAAVSSCSNDPTWYKRGDPDKDCAWVEKFVPTRCAVKGATTFAYQGCPLACGTCANSECGAESTSWYLGSNPSKNCGWVADAAGNRCHKQADGTYAFEACPFACSACSISGCEDSDDWAKPGEPSKDCSWVAEAKSNRCIVLGADGTYAYESCSAACHSCYEALVGSDCANDESWHKRADPSKTCDWVASFTPARCLVKGEDDEWGFEMCPEACDAC